MSVGVEVLVSGVPEEVVPLVPEDALPLWLRATAISPGLEAGWIKVASAYAALGRKTEAIEAARKCLVYHPDSERAHELLKAFE